MKYLSLIFVLASASTALAQESTNNNGGFFIEPSISYESSNWTATFPSPLNDTNGTNVGLGAGIKAGFHFAEIAFAGIDIMASQPTFKNPPNNYEAKATSTLMGAIVGMQMPVTGLRAWAGYIFRGDLDPDKSNNLNFKFKDATGYKLGAGFQISRVSLNLEYLTTSYASTELEEIGPFAPNTNVGDTKLKNNAYVLSVSLPITL